MNLKIVENPINHTLMLLEMNLWSEDGWTCELNLKQFHLPACVKYTAAYHIFGF